MIRSSVTSNRVIYCLCTEGHLKLNTIGSFSTVFHNKTNCICGQMIITLGELLVSALLTTIKFYHDYFTRVAIFWGVGSHYFWTGQPSKRFAVSI